MSTCPLVKFTSVARRAEKSSCDLFTAKRDSRSGLIMPSHSRWVHSNEDRQTAGCGWVARSSLEVHSMQMTPSRTVLTLPFDCRLALLLRSYECHVIRPREIKGATFMVSDCSHAHALLGLVVYATRSLHWLDASTQENFQSSVRRRGLHGSIYILASLPLPSRTTSVSTCAPLLFHPLQDPTIQ
jgi:hypothetical protein